MLQKCQSAVGSDEIVRRPERLTLSSGVESDEWLAGANREPDTRAAETSGSEMYLVPTEDEPNVVENVLDEVLLSRRQEVHLYAQLEGISENEAAQRLVEEARMTLGPLLAKTVRNVMEILESQLKTLWDEHHGGGVAEADETGTEEDMESDGSGRARRVPCLRLARPKVSCVLFLVLQSLRKR